MTNSKINIVKLFGYHPAMLSGTQHDDWFDKHSEPRPSRYYAPPKILEEEMDEFVYVECNLKRSRRAAG